MTQAGEFSLVIAKLGKDAGSTVSYMQPLMAVVAAVTSFAAPLLVRNGNRIADLLARRVPPFLKHRSDELEFWAGRIRGLVSEETPTADHARRSLALVALNMVIIGALLIGAELVIGFVQSSAGADTQETGLLVGGGSVLLSVAPLVVIWRGLRGFLEAEVQRIVPQGVAPAVFQRRHMMNSLPLVTATGLAVISTLAALPLFMQLLSIGTAVHFIPFTLVGFLVAWLARDSLARMHKRVEVSSLFRTSLQAKTRSKNPRREPGLRSGATIGAHR